MGKPTKPCLVLDGKEYPSDKSIDYLVLDDIPIVWIVIISNPVLEDLDSLVVLDLHLRCHVHIVGHHLFAGHIERLWLLESPDKHTMDC